MRAKFRKMIWIAPFAILGMVLFAFLGGTIVMLLWNWLLPPLVGLPQVTFWQAFGILALSRILFGGMGGRGGAWRSRSKFRERMAERWERMSPDERDRVRESWESWRGPWGPRHGDPRCRHRRDDAEDGRRDRPTGTGESGRRAEGSPVDRD